MQFPSPLIEARLLRRYKRFLADVVIGDEETTVHCANPGAMLGLTAENSRVWLSRSSNAARKLPLSWEIVEADFGWRGQQLVGINTSHPNRIAAEAISAGLISSLSGYTTLRREVRYGKASRVDILLETAGQPPCYVEIKNVHLMREPGLAEFPDSVTARGARHLDELGDMVEAGHRAVMLFVIQMEAERFTLARDIDPAYAAAFTRALDRGVEALAFTCNVTPTGITLAQQVAVQAS